MKRRLIIFLVLIHLVTPITFAATLMGSNYSRCEQIVLQMIYNLCCIRLLRRKEHQNV
jgi:hypothetical protein